MPCTNEEKKGFGDFLFKSRRHKIRNKNCLKHLTFRAVHMETKIKYKVHPEEARIISGLLKEGQGLRCQRTR